MAPLSQFTPLSPDCYRELLPSITNEDPFITITSGDVFVKLSALNPRKAYGPDGIPTWVLKENADILADPVRKILTTSYRSCSVPESWKSADVISIPKKKPITDVNDHLRPISLTPVLSKVADEFLVEHNLKPAILAKIDKK